MPCANPSVSSSAAAPLVGLTLALALRQALGEGCDVIVADPALAARPSRDPRASAIIAGCRRLFDALGVWDKVADGAQPITDMVVTDSALDDATRPTFRHSAARSSPACLRACGGEPPSGRCALRSRAGGRRQFTPARRDGFCVAQRRHHRDLRRRHDAGQVCWYAADGAKSALRQRAGIAVHGWEFDQSGIVVTVEHERDHGGRAEEHFLPAGPFAILPLKGKRASLVWTETRKDAEHIVALPDAEFHAELEKRFGLHLGEVRAVGQRRAFPLGYFVARSFIAPRLALVGDAAHVIHPIAGQGLNLGLKDVAALAEVIVDAARLGQDPGQADVLARYQAWRRFDTMAMGVATNGLNALFSNHSTLLRGVRDFGLGLVDRIAPLKSALIRQAAGLGGEVPRLLRGEGL